MKRKIMKRSSLAIAAGISGLIMLTGAKCDPAPGSEGSNAGLIVNHRDSNGPNGRKFEVQVKQYTDKSLVWHDISPSDAGRCPDGAEYPTCLKPPVN